MQSVTEGALDGFPALGLSPASLKALEGAGFQAPSPVQAQLIPPALAGRDCIGNAPTGTGKTAAFLLPLIEKIDDRDRRPQALILVPTRELAHQVGREFERLARGRRIRAAAVVGGESIGQQMRLLAGPCQLVIATPGRLLDLMDRGAVRFDGIRMVVLDEADQMLDIGFQPDIDTILASVPTERQTLLLSATMPKGVRVLTKKYLNDPADVRLIAEDDDATVATIQQSYVMVRGEHKLNLLLSLLERDQPERVLVFCRTKHGSDQLGNHLREQGHRAEPMHGDLSQHKRNRVLHAFRSGRVAVLVATDVVGRGIDVPEISHVVNFDVPEDPEHYVHRIGRTGRMGKDGVAYTFVQPSQSKNLDLIEKAIQRQIERHEVAGIPSPPRHVAPPKGHHPGGPRRGRAPFRGNRPFPPRRGQGGPQGRFGKKRRFGPTERVG